MSKIVLVPVVFACDRLRGAGNGAMIDESRGDAAMNALTNALRAVARLKGAKPTRPWLQKSTSHLLRLYEAGVAQCGLDQAAAAHVQDVCLPTGVTLRMGSPGALSLLQRGSLQEVH